MVSEKVKKNLDKVTSYARNDDVTDKNLPLRIGVAGSPSTGKSSISRALAHRLGISHIDVSEVAKKEGAGRLAKDGEFVLDLPAAKKAVKKRLESTPRGYVVEGSFLWDLVPNSYVDIVVVLRCFPLILAERYREAGYTAKKVKDNVVSELIGYVSTMCFTTYKNKCLEVDVSGLDAGSSVKKILRVMSSKAGDSVDWLESAASDQGLLEYLS